MAVEVLSLSSCSLCSSSWFFNLYSTDFFFPRFSIYIVLVFFFFPYITIVINLYSIGFFFFFFFSYITIAVNLYSIGFFFFFFFFYITIVVGIDFELEF